MPVPALCHVSTCWAGSLSVWACTRHSSSSVSTGTGATSAALKKWPAWSVRTTCTSACACMCQHGAGRQARALWRRQRTPCSRRRCTRSGTLTLATDPVAPTSTRGGPLAVPLRVVAAIVVCQRHRVVVGHWLAYGPAEGPRIMKVVVVCTGTRARTGRPLCRMCVAGRGAGHAAAGRGMGWGRPR
jgi:hypothetical protein